MRNTYCLNQVKFITEYTNVQHVIIKKALINLIKIKSLFTTVEGSSLNLSIAQDSAWHLA